MQIGAQTTQNDLIKTMVQKFEICDSIEARKLNLSEGNQKFLFRYFFDLKIEKILIFFNF